MIKTNIWIVFILYVVYAIISPPLFLLTSGGWVAFFFFLAIGGIYYISSSVLLFMTATLRTSKRRTKVTINGKFLRIFMGLQAFVVLFNYDTCGETICYQGFLPTLLEEASIPVFFAPPFVVVLLALILYLLFLSFFLLDIRSRA
ncbi:hypothetical protein [Lyngbya aestuarii]|uniref:hypothetical protein n=1 Tax=Lyngbya aestuarii TaxID=118322 RepID=UPI00403D892D